jgi:hypothetical protein
MPRIKKLMKPLAMVKDGDVDLVVDLVVDLAIAKEMAWVADKAMASETTRVAAEAVEWDVEESKLMERVAATLKRCAPLSLFNSLIL